MGRALAPLTFPERRQVSRAVDDTEDVDLLIAQLVDQAIVAQEQLTDGRLIRLGDEQSSLRQFR